MRVASPCEYNSRMDAKSAIRGHRSDATFLWPDHEEDHQRRRQDGDQNIRRQKLPCRRCRPGSTSSAPKAAWLSNCPPLRPVLVPREAQILLFALRRKSRARLHPADRRVCRMQSSCLCCRLLGRHRNDRVGELVEWCSVGWADRLQHRTEGLDSVLDSFLGFKSAISRGH